MRTKRKNYDYHSSDSANEDYEQDDYEGDDIEEDEPAGESDADSAYGESNGDKKGRQSSAQIKVKKHKNSNDYVEDEDESYEDEDPFSPEIDLILADKQVEVNPVEVPSQSQGGLSRQTRIAQQHQQVQKQNWYLVKFTDQSYLHVKWMEEKEMDEYSYRAKQKIRRYWIAKEKKRAQLEYAQRQAICVKPQIHHFSDDEEEEDEDEAGIKNIPLPDIPAILEDIQEVIKRKTLEVVGPTGEDLAQYFDKNFVAVERILSTTTIFPVVHPRQARQVRGKWQEDCLRVINVLVNFKKNNVCIGLTFAEQLDPENEELANYFKIVKQPIDLIMIMNRLYNKFYNQPMEFWFDLGLVFKNCRSFYKNTKMGLRKQCDALRALAFHLYKDWYLEQKTRFETGIALPHQSQLQGPTNLENQSFNNNNQSQNLPDFKSGQNNQNSNTFQQQPNFNKASETTPPEKDPTIVNLASLFDTNQNTQQQNIEPLQIQQQWSQPSYQQPPQYQNFQNMMQPQQNELPGGQQPDFWNAISNQSQTSIVAPQFANNFQNNSGVTPSLPKIDQLFNQPELQSYNEQFQQLQMQQNLPTNNQYNDEMPDLMRQLSIPAQNINIFYNQQLLQETANFDENSVLGKVRVSEINLEQSIIKQFFTQTANAQNSALQTQSYGGVDISQRGILTDTYAGYQPQNSQLLGQGYAGQQQFQGQTNDYQSLQNYVQYPNDASNSNFNGQNNAGGNSSLYPQENLMLMGQGGQDYNQQQQQNINSGMLPSLSSLGGLNNPMGLQLPSLSQMAPILGNSMDSYNLQQQNNIFNSLLNPPQANSMAAPQNQYQQQYSAPNNGASGFNQMDEYSYMFGAASGAGQALGNMNNKFNPYTFAEQQQQQLQQQQMLDYNNQMSHFNAPQSQFNQMGNNYNMIGGAPYGGGQQQIVPSQQQLTTDINFNNLLQPEENYNEKQEPPVAPAIIDPGQFDLSWILEKGERQEQFNTYLHLSQDEIQQAIQSKHNIDVLYLIKWKSLSYTQSTWECQSRFNDIFGDKIQDYLRFNRSLDQFQRDRMDQLMKNHKKMLRITEKKYLTGRKPDPVQENYLQLQEQKYNRQLLNYKLQELLGNSFNQIIQYSEAKGFIPQFKKPEFQLKDYQINGLNWLIRAWHDNRNVVLADEMGLGKTIMTLAFFDHLFKMQKLRGPFLILAPLTTLEHWKRIADEWTSMNSILYYDQNSAEGRQDIRSWEWFFTDITYKGTTTQKSELYKFNIMITSFEVFMQDLNPILQEIPFVYIVVDEAHRLKNKQAKTLRLLKDHSCKRILLLTGTPVQNNTKELWTLLNYIEPEKFSSMDQFLEDFGNLETYEQITRLHTLIKPHFLRRLKEEVDNSIPPLQETVIEVGLTSLQNAYYKGIYGENRMMLAKFGTNSIKTTQLNNIDIQLRKCCNHLFLLKGVEEELTKDCRNEEDMYKKLLESSGKLMLLDKFIDKFKQENHKMLIFSQFKKMLDIIELYLKMKGLSYEMLTGSVKTQDRISAIQRFNDDKTFGVFLLTTRAGGLGINLTSARVVIIFDSDWNPQNDLQAIARAHRIGQKFEVQVYRLITTKTYEEQMFERASKKLGMEQALFSKGAFHQDEAELTGLALRGLAELKQDSKDIENLLKYGAYAFIENDENDDMMNQQNKDIDEILATGKKKEFSYNKGVYTLQKSSFNASKYEKLPDINDPDFWNKALPFESIISINVLEKKFKKEKKELNQSEKLQKEYIKDIEIVFNDFMETKFDTRTSTAAKKQLEVDEEKLREILKKMIKLTGMKLAYVEKCKEWLREMLRTNKRKKTPANKQHATEQENINLGLDEEDDVEEDDIILDDSDEQFEHPINARNLRKRTQKETTNSQQQKQQSENHVVEKGKRGRKPANWGKTGANNNSEQARMNLKRKHSDDEQSDYEDEDDAYGDEEAPQQEVQEYGEEQNEDDEQNEDSEGPDARYGLRARKKRLKTSKDDYFTPHQRMNMPKINEQFAKRNEKNGIVCSYCLRPEPPFCYWFCHGYCQRFFHSECKDMIFSNMNLRSEVQKNYKLANNNLKASWICDDCLDNKAQCFCCKQKGQILLFPKKGRPKAAGSFENQLNPNADEIEGEENQEVEEDYEEDADDASEEEQSELGDKQQALQQNEEEKIGSKEDANGNITTGKKENRQDEEEDVLENQGDGNEAEELEQPLLTSSPSKIVINTVAEGSSSSKIEEEEDEGASSNSNSKSQQSLQEDESEEQQDKQPLQQPLLPSTTSTKIVLNTSSFKSLEPPEIKPPKVTAAQEEENKDKQYVVRCTLGGCFKYYHVSCVYKNKNVSCINSMKVQRFRCPLHYCDICQVSGDSVLIVQCVTCPTAYHLKCLPQDTNAIRLTKKYIICGKHNMSPEDFPRYEEKAATQYTSGNNQSGSTKNLHQLNKGGMKERRLEKNKLKKKGKKQPKSSYNDDDYESEKDQYSSPASKSFGVGGANTKELVSTGFMISLPDGRNQYNNSSNANHHQSSSQHYHPSGKMGGSSGANSKKEAPKPLFSVVKPNKH